MRRKTIIARMLAVLTSATMLFLSCSKEESFDGGEDKGSEYLTFIKATAEKCAETKASLDGNDIEGYEVTWDEDDILIAYLSSGMSVRRAIFELVDGAGTTHATFGCMDKIDWSSYRTIDAYCDYDPDSDKWPSRQEFNPGRNMGISPMKATSFISGGEPSLDFKNVGGAFEVHTTGCCLLKNVTIEADNLEAITLDCGENGVQIRQETTSLWFSLPAGNYRNFKITFADMSDNVTVKSLKKDLVIERSKVTIATISGVPEMPLKLNLASARMDAVRLDWMAGRIAEGHPYSVKYAFHKDDSISLLATTESAAAPGIRFITDLDSKQEGMYMTSMFYGLGATRNVDYAVVYPYSESLTANNNTVHGVSIPARQEISAEMTEPSTQLWAGSASLSDEAGLCVVDNMMAWVKVGLTEYVSKVVFRSNNSADVLSSSDGLKLEKIDGGWHLALTGSGTCFNYVSAERSTPGFGDVWMSVLPCNMTEGFTLEFYTNAGDEQPMYVKRFDGSLNLQSGDILDCDKAYRDIYSSVLAMYNDPADGYFYQVCGQRQEIKEQLDINNVAMFSDKFVDGYYPMSGQSFDVCFYANLDGGFNSLNVNGYEVEGTGKTINVSGIEFKEYVAHGVVIPISRPARPYSLAIINNSETIGVIPLPYIGFRDTPQERFEYGCNYVLATDDYKSFIRSSSNDYDYRIATDGSCMDYNRIWHADAPKTPDVTRARLYAVYNDRNFYLQHQYHRPIVYTSANTQGIELWGEWTLNNKNLLHVTENDTHSKFYPDAQTEGVLGAVENAPAAYYHAYKIEEIR